MLFKYPKTYHVPWSLGITSNDKKLSSMSFFEGKRVIVTRKMDGENSSLYRDYYHARSLDGKHHPSRDWLKNFWSGIAMDIPDGWRVCGENLFAKHSIHYKNLKSYFLGFSVWNGQYCLDWDSTQEWFKLLSVTPVPVLYDGIYNEKTIKSLWKDSDGLEHEGYVVRVAEGFDYPDFSKRVAKFVRLDHVQSEDHWMHSVILKNQMELPWKS